MSAAQMPPRRATSKAAPGETQADSDVPAAPPTAHLGRALLAGIRTAWDRLGLVLGISLTWSVLMFVPLTLWQGLPSTYPLPSRVILAAAAALLALSAPTAGAFYAAFLVCAQEEVSYADVWHGARRLFGPAFRLGLIHLVVVSVLVTNLWFYVRIGHLFGGLAALFCLYALLFWGTMGIYHWPLLAAQEAGVFDEPGRKARRGAGAVMRRAFFLALGSPFFSMGLVLVVPTPLMIVPLVPLLWLGLVAILTTQATRALLVQYAVLPPPPATDAMPDEGFRLPNQNHFKQD
jgi:hypothetical protein